MLRRTAQLAAVQTCALETASVTTLAFARAYLVGVAQIVPLGNALMHAQAPTMASASKASAYARMTLQARTARSLVERALSTALCEDCAGMVNAPASVGLRASTVRLQSALPTATAMKI